MLAIFIAVVMLIVYGSLYPWTFHAQPGLNPLELLLSVRGFLVDRRFIADILINLALYVPVGMAGYLALLRKAPRAARTALPIVFGCVLSASIEMAQSYVPGRRTSLLDLLNNTIGSAVGVAAGVLFEALEVPRRASIRGRRVDRSALALLAVWAGSLTFPLFPVMWLFIYRQKIASLVRAPWHSMRDVESALLAFASAVVSWYAGGLMLRAAGLGWRWLWMFVACVPAQFFIITRVPSVAGFAGAIAGTLAARRWTVKNVGWVSLLLIILRGLWPFHAGAQHSFSLIPFAGFLEMPWQDGIRILLEKAWNYGSTIWMIEHGGTRMFVAVGAMCAATTAIEITQMSMPAHTSEITDPLIVLLIGLAMKSLRRVE